MILYQALGAKLFLLPQPDGSNLDWTQKCQIVPKEANWSSLRKHHTVRATGIKNTDYFKAHSQVDHAHGALKNANT